MKITSKNTLRALKRSLNYTEKHTEGILKHINFKFENEHIELCATDGNALCLDKIEILSGNDIQGKFILNSDDLKLFLKMLEPHKKFNFEIELIKYDNYFDFNIFGNSLKVRIIDAQFPLYEQLITGYGQEFYNLEADKGFNVSINRKLLLEILKSFESSYTELINFKFTGSLSPIQIQNAENAAEFALLMPMTNKNLPMQNNI